MVLPPGEQHGVGGGLRTLTAFLVFDFLLGKSKKNYNGVYGENVKIL